MKIYLFGNGNIHFEEFLDHYITPLERVGDLKQAHFLLCDFRGLDTLMMEYLKSKTANVTVYHIGERPRYLPDKYKTKVQQWTIIGGFTSDEVRDKAAIQECTHYLAFDKNSNEKRKSGTLKNMELCESLNKTNLAPSISSSEN